MNKRTWKNSYDSREVQKEFFTKIKGEDKTDQSQLAGASIVEMAKKFGIDAIIAKAEQTYINENLQDKLYGHDLTSMYQSKEELLNVKKKLNNLFENIPARIRKEVFNDDPAEFLNAYTFNDETKLAELNKLGIVSDTQINQVKEYNQMKAKEKAEAKLREQFVNELQKQGDTLYENFKKTGNVTNNSGTDISKGTGDVQQSV